MEIYDALREAGASEEKSRKAAEVMSGRGDVDRRLMRIEIQLATLETELTRHRWAFGLVIALQVAILVKLMIP